MIRDMFRSAINHSPFVARASSAIRGSMQEREAKAAKRRVSRSATLRGIVAPSREQTIALLRRRLEDRAVRNGWPRRKGDLHIFVTSGLSDWDAVLPSAFEPFGEVTAFGWASHGFDSSRSDWWERRPEMNRAMLSAFHRANLRRPIDAVVGYLGGYYAKPSVLARMADAGAAVFNFSYDEKLGADDLLPDGTIHGPTALASVVDLNLTNDPAAVLGYALNGGLAEFHAEAADPRVHRPYDAPFEHDVSFVGACYGFRPFFIRRLEEMGVEVAAFGRGWPGGALPLAQMVETYSKSRINLGFGGIGHSRNLMCLKGRDFEVPLSGGLYLTQHNPELELVFDVGVEIVTYVDEADCAAKIRDILRNDAKAAAIRKAGRERCLRDHTYEARWGRVFRLAGIIE